MTAQGSLDSLFNVAEGERQRDEGMERAERGAPVTWNEAVDRMILAACWRYPEHITSEVVWALLEEAGWPMPREPRAMGPRMYAAARAGLITPIGTERATRSPRHRGWVAVYRANGSPPDDEMPF